VIELALHLIPLVDIVDCLETTRNSSSDKRRMIPVPSSWGTFLLAMKGATFLTAAAVEGRTTMPHNTTLISEKHEPLLSAIFEDWSLGSLERFDVEDSSTEN
jgi:hypothetical protein